MNAISPTPRGTERQHRLATMAELVLARGSVSVEELVERYGVSAMTVYRDLAELEASGVVERNRGQVSARATSFSEASAAFRGSLHAETKARLAERAVAEVNPGATIMLDDSTSALGMVALLRDRGPVTVITHSQAAARAAAAVPSLRLFVTGGRYRADLDSLFGSTTVANLRALHANVCFMSTTSLLRGELYHPLEENVDVKRAMLASADRAVLLVDSSKFGRGSTHRIASVDEFDLVVVDSAAPEEELAIIRDAGVEIAVVPAAGR